MKIIALVLMLFAVVSATLTYSVIHARFMPSTAELAFAVSPDSSVVSVIDLTTRDVVNTIDVGAAGCLRPEHGALSADSNILVVTCRDSYDVLTVDVVSQSVDQIIAGVAAPSGLALTSDGNHAIVTRADGAGYFIIHLPTQTIVPYTAPDITHAAVVHPFLDRAYAIGDSDIFVIDLATGVVVDTIALSFYTAWDIDISPNGDWLYVADGYTGGLAVIDVALGAHHTTIQSLRHLRGGLAVAGDGKFVYAGNTFDDTVEVVDAITHDHVGTIPIGEGYGPTTIALTCDNAELFVGVDVSSGAAARVFDTATYEPTDELPVDTWFSDLALCPPAFADGVAVFPPIASNTGALGEQLAYALTIHNLQEDTGTFVVSHTVSAWPVQLSATDIGPLAPGASETITALVTVPADAAWFATHQVAITATATSDASITDSALLITRAYAPPQLAIDPETVSVTLEVGATAQQAVALSNGNGVTATFELIPPPAEWAVAGWSGYPLADALAADPELADLTFVNLGDSWNSAELAPHDGVIVSDCAACMTASEAHALRDFVATGRPLLFGMSNLNYVATQTREPLLQILGVSAVTDGNYYFDAINAAHPIAAGVATVYGPWFQDSFTLAGADWIARGTDGGDYVVAYDGPDARSIGVGYDFHSWRNSGNETLVRNALRWSLNASVFPSWLAGAPISDTIPSERTLPLTLSLDASALQPGAYAHTVHMATSDPAEIRGITVTLNVTPTAAMGWVDGSVIDDRTGAPVAATITAEGQPFSVKSDAGGSYTLWLDAGTHTLHISAPGYEPATASVALVAGIETSLSTHLIPSSAEFSFGPHQITSTQPMDAVFEATITITNTGPVTLTVDTVSGDSTFVPYPHAPSAIGGPDAFGYTYRDSNEPEGPTYAWSDIRGTGTEVTDWSSTGNGYAGPVPLGFDFNFYGVTYNQLYIGTNGYITFGQGYYSVPVGAPPAPEAPDNAIAFFGGDRSLNSYETPPTTFHYQTLSDPTRFVLQVDNLYDTYSYYGPWRDMQLVLYPNGNILMQYASMGGSPTAYVGLENSNGTIGLSYPEPLPDGHAICFAYPGNGPSCAGIARWFDVAPARILVPPGQTGSVAMTLDATGRQPGTYTANLTLAHNDPHTAIGRVPVVMAVEPASGTGVVAGAITDAWTGDPLAATVWLDGSAITPAVTGYRAWASSGIHDIAVGTPGYVTETMSLTVFAGVTTTLDIDLEPAQPRLGLSLTAIDATVTPNSSTSVPVTLRNDGPVPLEVLINERSLPETAAVPLPPYTRILLDEGHGARSRSTYDSLRYDLEADGATIAYTAAPLDLDLLSGYDVLWICRPMESFTVDERVAIRAWVEAGGGLLLCFDYSYYDGASTLPDLGGDFGFGFFYTYPGNSTTDQIYPHATTEGVEGYAHRENDRAITLPEDAALLIRNSDDDPIAAARTVGAGRVVIVTDDGFNDTFIDTAENRLFANNVVAWLADPGYTDVPWLSADTGAVTIAGHSALTVHVELNGTDLDPGTYGADVVLRHNDPAREPVALPVTLEVVPQTAAVSVALSAAIADIYAGATETFTVTIINEGNGPDSFTLGIDTAWTGALSHSATPQLEPGASFETTLVLTAPAGPLSGTGSVTVTATSDYDNLVTAFENLTLRLRPRVLYLPFTTHSP